MLYGLELLLGYSNFRPTPDQRGLRISVQLQLEKSNTFMEISQTETIFDLPSSSFTQKTSLPYRFDSAQLLRFQANRVVDVGDEQVVGRDGEVDIPLPALLFPPSPLVVKFPSGLQLLITLRIPPSYNDYIRLQFGAEHLKSFNNYPLAAYLMVVLVTESRTLLLHKTETIKSKEALWSAFRVPVHPISAGGNLEVHVYNENTNARDSLIGYFVTSLSQIMMGAGSHNVYMLMDASGARRSEKLHVDLKKLERDSGPSFFDILKSGCELRPSVAVDFTATNGNPLQADSLHYVHPHTPGPYAGALHFRLGPVLLHARDPRVSAVGFGAKMRGLAKCDNCFPMNPRGETVHGLGGVLEAYRIARMEVQPYGPTEFADVIYNTSRFAKASMNLQMNAFFLLFIFTDGCGEPPMRTIDALVDAAAAPMVVVFVMVGTQEKRKKDGESIRSVQNHPLKHSDGRIARRQVAIVVSDTEDDGLGLVPLIVAQWKNLAESAA